MAASADGKAETGLSGLRGHPGFNMLMMKDAINRAF